MDCCNYMQYRHHQPYYGSQYCDPFPLYHAEFYGHQIYQDYYGNSSYYPPQWPYTASFPDYVYNPKEARIRKAMRDATRERSIGASPMLSRPNTRRASQSWGLPHDDIMMSSLGGVHSSIETTVCGGFELSTPGNNQFMTPMTDSGFTNLEPPTPPPPPPPLPPLPSPISSTNTVHSKYIQPNPLAQLQQHAEMWHDYPTLRPRSSGNPYILPEILSYHSQASESTNNLLEEKISHLQSAGSHPQNHTQSMTHEISRKTRMDFDEKLVVEGSQESSRNHDHSIFETTADMDSRIEQHNDELKIKKVAQIHINTKKSINKPLPDFNEAFGSTERGRFQSIPDARLAPNKGYVDHFFDISPIKFDDYHI